MIWAISDRMSDLLGVDDKAKRYTAKFKKFSCQGCFHEVEVGSIGVDVRMLGCEKCGHAMLRSKM